MPLMKSFHEMFFTFVLFYGFLSRGRGSFSQWFLNCVYWIAHQVSHEQSGSCSAELETLGPYLFSAGEASSGSN